MLLYEGKAKQIFSTENQNEYLVYYKDDATAFNGIVLEEPIFELSYKNDDYGDPMLNDDHAVAMKLATREELASLKEETLKINEIMKKFFLSMNFKLVDFKLEFGKDVDGNIILADEISPDTCRLWDVDTNEKFDKDRFRRDLGDLVEAYTEVLSRIEN